MSRLVVAFPGSVLPGDEPGAWSMDAKTLDGLAHYRRRWPGELVLAGPLASPDTIADASERSFMPHDLGFEVVTADTLLQAVRAAEPDLVLAHLNARTAELESVLDRMVLVTEFAPDELTRHDLTRVRGTRAAITTHMRGRLRARRLNQWAAQARGVQCNGHPAHDHFAPIARSSLLFFDTRLTLTEVDAAAARDHQAPRGGAAHACFSGRWVPAKGVDHAVELARRNPMNTGAGMRLTVLGSGELEQHLRATAPDNVAVRGHLAFSPDWTRFVRDEVDLMVLPHLQGDPSGTYLEAAGCGTPVLGFANVALESLVRRHGLGWVAPLGDDDALDRAYRHVLEHPDEWATARRAGIEFMRQHHVDAEFDRRVEHLLTLV